MNELITLISLLCARSAPGHGATYEITARTLSAQIREDAFNEQAACTRRLFRECTTAHKITGTLLPKESACLVEKL